MNRRMIASASLTVLLVLASLGECVSLSSAVQPPPVTQTDPRQMRFEPVQFTPPEPDRVVLENGMIVYLLEDHELPLISITATMRTGSWLDPAEKIGLASLTGFIMRTGGGGGLSAERVDEELEQFAGDVGLSIGRQSCCASL